MKSDIQIAQECTMRPIVDVAKDFGINPDHIDLYGRYKAKANDEVLEALKDKPNGKLILVTAVNPTPAGEGKTTTTIGLAQALNKLGKRTTVALREPSLGPCMGVKGGAAGGGYAQVVPMEDINLHFTGDLHAISAAHNLLSAMLDNHIQQGNALDIDTRQVVWKRALDMNDRALRHVVVGMGGKANGVPREDGFMITVASEVMAVLCLAMDLADLKARLAKMIVAYTRGNKPVTAGDLQAQGAMAALLKDAVKPNLVQTLEGTLAIIHGGPFANIAHGCNSVRATKLALKLGDIAVTEAGFGADLGAEKFFDIKCRKAGLKPDAVVLVATVRALKYNGGVKKEDLNAENVEAVKAGCTNLRRHIENLQKYGVPVVVTLNAFTSDTPAEIAHIKAECEAVDATFALSEVWADGGNGGIALAEKVLETLANKPSSFAPIYDETAAIKAKIEAICKSIYGAAAVNFTQDAKNGMARIKRIGLDALPVCIAKTQYSLSDNPALLGAPEGFTVTVKEVRVSAGAGFIVALAGDIMIMPGLPPTPAACGIDVDAQGNITGLF